MQPVPDDTEVIDPARHQVYAVTVEMTYDTWVVAESEEEACEIASQNRYDDMMVADWNEYASVVDKPPFMNGADLPWGPCYYGGKQVTIAEAIEIIKQGPAGVGVTDTDPPNLANLKPHPIDEWLEKHKHSD